MRLTLWTWLIATGIGAAITTFAPALVTVAAISIVGLPLAIALLFAPLAFCVSLGGWVAHRIFNMGSAGFLLGAALTLAGLAVPAYLINTTLDARVAALVQDDRDAIVTPLHARVIAVRSFKHEWFNKDETRCNGFCMRALMNGVAERVLFIEQDLNQPLDPAMPAQSFRIEKRTECPAVNLQGGRDDIKENGRQTDYRRKFAHELMQLQIAKGNCLIEETVPLGQADIVLSHGVVHRGLNTMGAGLDPFADTANASRLSMHVREGDGFREVYRATGVVAYRLAPVLTLTAEMGAELRTSTVLARFSKRTNLASYESEPDWSAFLTGKLGFDLALRDSQAEDDTRELLARAVDSKGPLDTAAKKLGGDFIDGISRRSKMAAEDYPLARAVLTDQRFALPMSAWAAVRYAKDGDDEYFAAIATGMFERLAAIAREDDGKRYPAWAEDARRIGSVVQQLPARAILPHRAELEWLAKQERLRLRAHDALVSLHLFGADAVPTLLWLMDDAVRLKGDYGTDWNNPYVAALTGLCLMGREGESAIRPIYERLAAGTMQKYGAYWGLTIRTLARMGADPEEMWSYLQTSDKNQSRGHFDRQVARALKREDCAY